MENKDYKKIIDYSINASKPENALDSYLREFTYNSGKLIVIAVGKAAFTMAKKTNETLTKKIDTGIVLTKYNHSNGPIGDFIICEAGHPIADENSFNYTKMILEATKDLSENDDVIFLLSGGGSALFEYSNLGLPYLQEINNKLLKSNADIIEINTIRKRLSIVKGGKFGRWCYPARVTSFILSDVISDKLDMIASGPTAKDSATDKQAIEINKKYNLNIDNKFLSSSNVDLPNCQNIIIGSVQLLAKSAKDICQKLSYITTIVQDDVTGNYLDLKSKVLEIVRNNQNPHDPLAFIYTGETTVEVKGSGLGGRNQQIIVDLIKDIKDFSNTTIFSIGSDGTDGPTDAAGGVCDNNSFLKAQGLNIDIDYFLGNNDSYNCLKQLDQLIITGPTGTNVNDLLVILIK